MKIAVVVQFNRVQRVLAAQGRAGAVRELVVEEAEARELNTPVEVGVEAGMVPLG